MSSEMPVDPIESASKGAMKGALEWTSEFVKEVVKKLKDKKLAFIQDEETIRIVKEQYNSGEWSNGGGELIEFTAANGSDVMECSALKGTVFGLRPHPLGTPTRSIKFNEREHIQVSIP